MISISTIHQTPLTNPNGTGTFVNSHSFFFDSRSNAVTVHFSALWLNCQMVTPFRSPADHTSPATLSPFPKLFNQSSIADSIIQASNFTKNHSLRDESKNWLDCDYIGVIHIRIRVDINMYANNWKSSFEPWRKEAYPSDLRRRETNLSASEGRLGQKLYNASEISRKP